MQAEAVAGSARVFAIGAPNRLGAVLSESDFARIAASEKTESEAIAYLYAQAGEQVIGVNAIENLRLHNNEYIFFRSDHHWTALGAYYAYEAWAEAAGFEPEEIEKIAGLYDARKPDAARLAKDAGVGKLLIGHYSSRDVEVKAYEAECRTVFPDTFATADGQSFDIFS